MRAVKASSLQSKSLLRASRTGLALSRQGTSSHFTFQFRHVFTNLVNVSVPVHSSFPRFASVATHTKTESFDDASEFDEPLPAQPESGLKEGASAKHTAVEGDNPAFSSLRGRIDPSVLQAIIDKPMNLTHMSPVQAQVLPLLPELVLPLPANAEDGEPTSNVPRDLLVKAKTGTGKTLGFLVPVIEARIRAIAAHCLQALKDAGLQSDKNLEIRAKRLFTRQVPGALIISPTRELAAQIADEAIKLTSNTDLEVRLFVGGVGKRQQLREWMRGRRDIVVGTPGRIRDLLENEPDVAESLSKVTNVSMIPENFRHH